MNREITIKSSLDGLKAYELFCSDPKYIMCCVHGIGEYFLRYERMAGILEEYGIKMIGMDLNIGGVIVWILVINSGLVFSYVTKRLKFLSFLI